MGGGHRWNPIGNLNPAFTGGPVTDRIWLYNEYIVKKVSARGIARISGCGVRKVMWWLRKFSIPIRTLSESAKLLSRIGESNPNWKGVSVCPECGGKKNSISKVCQKCHFKNFHGKNVPNYKGIVDITSVVRGYVYSFWRLRVFHRDGFTCQNCGDNKGGNLEAHHKKRLSVIIDKFISLHTDYLETPELRRLLCDIIVSSEEINDIDNGLTLCGKCHKSLHKGKRKDYYELPGNREASLYTYSAEVLKVINSNTVKLCIDLGFGMYKIELFNLYGIIPVNNAEQDRCQKLVLEKLLTYGVANPVPESSGKVYLPVRVQTYKPDKYGRFLAMITILSDPIVGNEEIDLNRYLIDNGLAKEYFGGEEIMGPKRNSRLATLSRWRQPGQHWSVPYGEY